MGKVKVLWSLLKPSDCLYNTLNQHFARNNYLNRAFLIALGYGTSFAADIIRESKKLMIAKGHTYYQSRKLDRVPREAVEELLGITLSEKQD